MLSNLINVSAAPHVRSKVTTASIMRDVVIALLPATVFGIWNSQRYGLGLNAFLLLAVCVIFCVATEYVYEKLMKKPVTIGDFSAVVTAMILGLNLPATLPLWIAALGSIFAILVVKMVYGGLGQNFMNPALGARCFLVISFAARMTAFPAEFAGVSTGVDAVATATPLTALKAGATVDVWKMFVGTTSGTIGETSVIALLIGAIYLVAKKIISLRIPATYIITTILFVIIFGGHGFDTTYILAHLCGGGLIFGAFFMATDYVTSPITPMGQIVFGIILGIITGVLRVFGGSAEGVSYAIIITNLLVPLIERFTMPKAFGKEGKKHE